MAVSHTLFYRIFPAAFTLALVAGLLVTRPCHATELHRCALENDVGGAAVFLHQHGAKSVNTPAENLITPLHIAAAANHFDIAALLVDRGADVSACTVGGFTPLHWAAARDAAKTTRLLLQRGADASAETSAGITPLHWAAGNNATNALKLLLTSGARLDATTVSGFTPLHWAVLAGSIESGIILAYKAVTDDVIAEGTNRPSAASRELAVTAEEELRLPPGRDRDADPLEADHTVRPSVGGDVLIPLGQEQDIEFVWLEPLKMWVGRFEVSNGQFRRFDAEHSSLFRDELALNTDEQPVVYVPWYRAKAFCAWINRDFASRLPRGCEVRLPTSEEWTALARCGDERTYPWGDEWPPRYGNYSDEAAKGTFSDWSGIEGYRDGHAVSCPIRQSGCNEWGVFGLAGNVWEWCEDWHGGEQRYKVRRGGGWDFDRQTGLRIDHIGFDRPKAAYDTIGFRPVIATKESIPPTELPVTDK